MLLRIQVYWLLLCLAWSARSDDLNRSINQTNMLNTSGPLESFRMFTLCDDSRCSCNSSSQSVINISCQCTPQDQEATLDIHPSSVPRNVSDVVIKSCRSVFFHEGGLKELNNLSIVNVVDVGEVVFHSGAFNQIGIEREATITIRRCRHLTIKSGAFHSHPSRPVVLYSSHCHTVLVEEFAFLHLLRLNLTNVQLLNLASQAFRFATGSSVAEEHIHTEIAIEHVIMKELKSFTFPSPLDRLAFENVTILGHIHPNTTSALRIAHLSIRGSRIGSIFTSAFSEFTHLDSFELQSTRIDQIATRALASASSSFTLESCQIGRMNQDALSMPVARINIRSNHIEVLATGAICLREWNELLVENNTVSLVERHAFYNIGEPKYPKPGQSVRFIIRRNVFLIVQQGAFIINAQVPQLQLEDNQFKQDCDCQMSSWTDQLTQINRRTETSTSDPPENSLRDALWLGSSLFNSSLCWIDDAVAHCFKLSKAGFLFMEDYTYEACSTQRQSDANRCITTSRLPHDSRSTAENTKPPREYDNNLVGLNATHDLIVVIVLGVLCALVLVAACFGLTVSRLRNKARRQGSRKNSSTEERVTCSPLITNSEKQLGSGVVSSGSISRLTVKEYRSYLEDSGPIYSEPLDPPMKRECSAREPVPPAVPAMPPQWTPKDRSNAEDANKRTIDRGTQTFEEIKENVDCSAETPSSLALEFTKDVMAALRNKLDISPFYSEVKDTIVSSNEPRIKNAHAPELYDLIKVVDLAHIPSTTSAASDHVYCSPWGIKAIPPFNEAHSAQRVSNEEAIVKNSAQVTLPLIKQPNKLCKSEPFYIRGSLPKWPPPVTQAKLTNRHCSISKASSLASPSTSLENTSSKPPIALNRPMSIIEHRDKLPSQDNLQKLQESCDKPKVESIVQIPSGDEVLPGNTSRPSSTVTDVDGYAEVEPRPFSFSFRKPLFSQPEKKQTFERTLKLERSDWLCEYADPLDLSEPMYSELTVEDDSQPNPI